jgi:hypothetical protein
MRATRKSQKKSQESSMGVTSFAPPPKKAFEISRCGFLMGVTEKLQKSYKKAARESQKCHKKVIELSHEKLHAQRMGDMKNACGTHGSPLKLHTN